MSARAEGYYWVRRRDDGEPGVAYYRVDAGDPFATGGEWFACGWGRGYADGDDIEVLSERLEPPVVQP